MLSGIPPVLLHGDCWGSNIIFEAVEGGSLSSNVVAFIDWQTSTEGTLTTITEIIAEFRQSNVRSCLISCSKCGR